MPQGSAGAAFQTSITRLSCSQPSSEIVAVHSEAKNIELKAQALGSPIPFHPGAKKYLEEKGVKVQ